MQKNDTTAPAQAKPLSTADRAAMVTLAVLAAVYALAIGVFGVLRTVNAITAHAVTVPQPSVAPVSATASGSIQLVEGTYVMADITVTGVTNGIRTLLASSFALDTLMHVAVAFGVIMLSIALLKGRPFRRAIVRTLIITCLALVVGGMLSPGLLGFANMALGDGLNDPGFPAIAILDFTPAIVGVVLALVAAAFQYGERIQRDTEGLI